MAAIRSPNLQKVQVTANQLTSLVALCFLGRTARLHGYHHREIEDSQSCILKRDVTPCLLSNLQASNLSQMTPVSQMK